MNSSYSVYHTDQLIDKLNEIPEISTDVTTFFNNFSFSSITNHNIAKNNSTYVFKNAIKEDTIKSKIIQLLNKLNQQNLTKIINMIREIVFTTQEELNELVYQCIQKIKRDNDQIRPLVAALCWELLSTYFVTAEDEKIYFRKLLLSEVKKDYTDSVDYNSDNWSKDHSEKTMILIGSLFNGKIIDQNIMSTIISDFKKNIKFEPDRSEEEYNHVEKSLQQLSCLISCIVLNEESKKVYQDLDIYLENQMTIYEDKKCISKKIRLVCKNSICELRK